MFNNLSVFSTARALAAHAGQRQAVISQNVANADTPGYAARDIPRFEDAVRRSGDIPMRATRTGHFVDGPPLGDWPKLEPSSPTDPNGNSVSLEIEMMKSVDAIRQHDRALAIYRSALGMLRSALSRN